MARGQKLFFPLINSAIRCHTTNITMRATRLLRLSVSLLISAGIAVAATAQTTRTKSLVEGNTAFALDLYGRLSETPGNLFFSPYSISTCLAMTFTGARGDTAAQMARTLHFDANQDQLAASFGELQRQLAQIPGKGGIELNTANALWAQKN